MDKVTSKRIKNNVLKIEKSCNGEKKNLNKRKVNMNKKKSVFVNELKNEEVIKKNLKKVKNDKISKNAKEKLESTYLINTRNKENLKKETLFKDLDKEKRMSNLNRAVAIKGRKIMIPEDSVNFLVNKKNVNLNSSNYDIMNYFQNNNIDTNNYDNLITDNYNNPNSNNNIDDHKSLLNQNNYLSLKNNIECNLMNYKKSKLDKIHLQNFNMNIYKSNDISNSETNVENKNDIYINDNEYIIDNAILLNEKKLQNSNILEISNKSFKESKGLNEIFDMNNSKASILLSRNSIYTCKDDNVNHNIMNNNKNNINVNDDNNIVNNNNLNNGNKNNTNNMSIEKDLIEKNECKNEDNYIYKYKERNKEYLDSINLPFNNKSEGNKDLLISSIHNRNILKNTKYNEELFSKNLINFENFCSYKFKKNINNNIINNICNMYEEDANFNVFINKKKIENAKIKDDFFKLKSNSFFPIKNDHFEGEKLFKKPKISLYNILMKKNKFEDATKLENKESDKASNILLNHQDLLINKREKIIINNDSNTKNIMKNYIKNFWFISKKEFFGKYSNSSLKLENREVEKLKELISFRSNENYSIDDLFNENNDIIEEEFLIKDYITDEKLKNFSLDLIDGFLYDKQSLYEREMIENEKIFTHISFNHKNYDVKIEKLLNLFPRDFMKKYKIVKKLGEGVYGKVFNAESLDDSYLNFAIKVLRYFWPNFKYKFGSEEFAINEFNIMRILFHPNVVCLLDSFRVHTYRKGKVKCHRNQKARNENVSAEYDFSFQRHRKVERNQYSPSLDTIERNNKYKNLIAKNYITIEDLEKDLVLYNIDKDNLKDTKFNTVNRNIKSLRSYNNDINNSNNHSYSSTTCKKDIKKERSNDISSNHLRKKMKTSVCKNCLNRNDTNKTKNKSLDKLKFRKHSKKLKKIESKNNDYIENWDLFLVIEKCDCSLNDILNKAKKKHSLFIQHIKQCTAQYLPSERIDMCYDHIHNYVKYVYLPLKKIENRSFYPEMPSLTEMQTKVIIYQMLQGINHFHKKFIIHRDIKPANTLIKNIQYLSDGLNDSKEWIVKIADFGLGVYDHFLKAETKDCNIITLQYRPPEILCNSTVYNYSVDIWSVGITMCECLLGFVPVTSKFESSVLFKILVFRGLPDQNFDDLLKKEFIGELPKFKTDRIKMLQIIFTDIYGRRILGDDGIDLIDQFLSYDYKNRITANQALKHKWFEDVHLYLNDDLLRYYKKNGTYYF
ncbi:cdc2-related protein kinase 4, putative [Plasmodium gallinaceum]|uniref:non-specific serine/threonine protein kinase n=1 Tax=Plasmodium gallinaceum TaxID=5849 RepID=A0A1J1GP65_PLAGA|nr:cdc2-related protein kinase 4, putative [Plasmodium gallinaceum]CRG94287.1 cdc2-related protein kinase 4, putative [Plasmodium gallinaceum]